MEFGRVGWNFWNFITTNPSFCLKISKSNKRAVWNMGMQVGKFLKFNKVCCTIIQETKVLIRNTKVA